MDLSASGMLARKMNTTVTMPSLTTTVTTNNNGCPGRYDAPRQHLSPCWNVQQPVAMLSAGASRSSSHNVYYGKSVIHTDPSHHYSVAAFKATSSDRISEACSMPSLGTWPCGAAGGTENQSEL